jgi:hypothetical protein
MQRGRGAQPERLPESLPLDLPLDLPEPFPEPLPPPQRRFFTLFRQPVPPLTFSISSRFNTRITFLQKIKQ